MKHEMCNEPALQSSRSIEVRLGRWRLPRQAKQQLRRTSGKADWYWHNVTGAVSATIDSSRKLVQLGRNISQALDPIVEVGPFNAVAQAFR